MVGIDALAKAAYGAGRARSKPSWDNLADTAKEQWRNVAGAVARAVLEAAGIKQPTRLLLRFLDTFERHCGDCIHDDAACDSCELAGFRDEVEAFLQQAGGGAVGGD